VVRLKARKRLWDDLLEREAYVRSPTAHEIYRLDGQVPETIVSGETADISPFATFKWYEWVLFRDTSVTYPDDTMVLGRDLGPAIDIGPAMTRKVLKANGKVVYRSTVPRDVLPYSLRRQDGKLSAESLPSCRRTHDRSLLRHDDIRQCRLQGIGQDCIDPGGT
jgi:hypothetical protein